MSMIVGVNDPDIQKFEIDDSIVSDNQAVGSFNLNTATIKLVNIDKQYNDLKDKWIDTILGKLYVYEAPSLQGEIAIELKCYDLAYKFDAVYEDMIEFPATVGEWLQAICNTVGVELGTPTFTNSDLLLDRRPFIQEGGSYRDAVKEIAGGAGGFAQIIDNKLHIKWFEDTNTDIPDWLELAQEDKTDAVNVVVLGRGDLEDNIVFPQHDGKNLLSIPDVSGSSAVGDLVYKSSNQVIVLNGGSSTSMCNFIQDIANKLIEADSYTLSINGISGSWNGGYLGVSFRSASGSQIDYLQFSSNNRKGTKSVSASTIENTAQIWIYCSTWSSFSDFAFTIQLEPGTEASEYEPAFPVIPHELRIDDNQVLYQREVDTIRPIYDQVVGFDYHIFQLRTIGLRDLKAGQKVTYNDIDGMRVSAYVMAHHMVFLGGDYNDPNSYESTVSSVQLNETNTNYSYAGSLTKRVSNTEAQVNKLDKNITLITEDVTQIRDEFGNYYTIDESNVLLQNAVDGLTNTFSRAGGNNLINNSSLFFGDVNNYDYWSGNLKQTDTELSVTKKALLLQQGVVVQNIKNLQAGWFSFRFKYKKIGTALDTTLHFSFNDVTYEALGNEGTVELSQDISTGINDIAFITNTSDQYIIYDLMLNYGQEVYLPYQQSQNELKSTQVSISENIKVESNVSNTITLVGANGLEGYNKNTNELVFKQTDTGSYSKFMKADSAEISDLMIRKVGNQVWITGIN